MKKLFQICLVCILALGLIVPNAFGRDRQHTYKRILELDTLSSTADGDFYIIYDASTSSDKKIDANTSAVAGNLKFQTNIFASGHDDGSTSMASDASHISSAWLAFGIITKVEIDAPSDQTRHIVDGVPGQMVTIQLTTKTNSNWIIGDDRPIVNTGWSTITFDTSGDSITLLWLDDTNGWIIVGNNGCTIA